MEINAPTIAALTYGASLLTGAERRSFIVRVVIALGKNSQRLAQRALGWSRTTIRKAFREYHSGITCVDALNMRGAKPATARLTHLLEDIHNLMNEFLETDPTFRTTQVYRRVSAAEVRRLLIEQKGYTDEELPSKETIRTYLNDMGFRPTRVDKSKPLKKVKETDAIFNQLVEEHATAKVENGVLRLSLDTKAVIKVGEFSRGGKSRIKVKACDHDFRPDTQVTPVGIYLPEQDELYLYMVSSKVTADCLMDIVEQFWLENKTRFPTVHTLLLNQDNGPENNSHRTQFILRVIAFVDKHHLQIRLAYYPPYHSKYNPVERCFGVLENHWNGSLLDTVEAVLGYAKSMRWNGKHPIVKWVTKIYQTGVRLTRKVMRVLETRCERLVGLEKWFVTIRCISQFP